MTRRRRQSPRDELGTTGIASNAFAEATADDDGEFIFPEITVFFLSLSLSRSSFNEIDKCRLGVFCCVQRGTKKKVLVRLFRFIIDSL